MGDSGTLYQTLNPFSGFFRHDTPVVATVPGHINVGQVQAVGTMYTQPTQCVINVRPNVRTVQCSTVVVLVLSGSILSILISNVAARLAVGLRLTIFWQLYYNKGDCMSAINCPTINCPWISRYSVVDLVRPISRRQPWPVYHTERPLLYKTTTALPACQ